MINRYIRPKAVFSPLLRRSRWRWRTTKNREVLPYLNVFDPQISTRVVPLLPLLDSKAHNPLALADFRTKSCFHPERSET